jgi:hypothetical protein
MRLFIVICAFFYSIIAVMPCQASIMTYDSEAEFLAAAGSVDFESFETLPLYPLLPMVIRCFSGMQRLRGQSLSIISAEESLISDFI